MLAGLFGDFSSSFGSAEESDLEEVGFDDVFEGVSFFAECCGYCFYTGGAAVVDVDQGTQDGPVQFIQA